MTEAGHFSKKLILQEVGGKGPRDQCFCVGGDQEGTSWQGVRRCCLCNPLQNLSATLRSKTYNSLKQAVGNGEEVISLGEENSLQLLKYARVFPHRKN